ncbi:OmpA family protein [Marinobacterium lutimaris]|uniref:OmpA family protein n=1 Tax=Marinobacterium lutimaris TaxID=568106 RepID=A0A1H5YTM4_9GAMM|nr:OmpA family protein [Marinobacterium lutimaris]SEG27619.1 OmpA family protein [Marinobacterium lutimaris]
MSRSATLLTSSLLLTTLSGCSIYSGAVNSLGPDKPVSDIAATTEGEVLLSTTPPPFCPAVVETYMVMPEDGRTGIVDVALVSGDQLVLEGDYAAAEVVGGVATPFTGDADSLRETFGDSISALPPAPIYVPVYFYFDSDILTEESMADAQRLYQAVLERAAPEVIVTGHTDTSGSKAFNQTLGQRRAEAVREDLIEIGVDPQTITTRSLGETQPVIETGDGVREPKNRRVEINVR